MVDSIIIVAVLIALSSVVFSSPKNVVVSMWLTSLVVGIKFLSVESGLLGLAIIFYSSLLSYILITLTQGMKVSRQPLKKLKWFFGSILFLGLSGGLVSLDFISTPFWSHPVLEDSSGVDGISRQLLEKHFLSAEILLVIAFMVLIGLGLSLRRGSEK